MTRRRRNGTTGLTLVETLISMFLGLVALAAVPIALRVVGAMTSLARDGTIALAAAQSKIEELIAAGSAAADGADEPPSPGASLRRTWHVESPDPRIPARSVTATVEWDGGAHRLTLETCTW